MARRKTAQNKSHAAKTEETLLRAVAHSKGSSKAMGAALDRLASAHGDSVYSGLIKLLSRLEFSPAAAKRHWNEVEKENAHLERTLGRPVDFRVALADHFISQSRKLRHPMVLEIQLFKAAEEERLTDGLTGLFNFRYMQQELPRQVAQAQRNGALLSVVFFDIDDFKAYNDHFGHQEGNNVLGEAGKILTGAIRESDLAVRYGGEEFALILPGSDKFGALAVAERVRAALGKLAIPAARPGKLVTVSGGVASYPADAAKAEELLACADSAMYRAKSMGKDQVLLFSKERRAWERRRERFTGGCQLGRRSLPLRGENLARGGFYLVSPHSVSPETKVALTLTLPSEGKAAGVKVKCHGRVTRCEPLGPKEHGLGITITEMGAADRRNYEAALAACGLS